MACGITVPGISNCILLEIMYCMSAPNNILLAFGKKIQFGNKKFLLITKKYTHPHLYFLIKF